MQCRLISALKLIYDWNIWEKTVLLVRLFTMAWGEANFFFLLFSQTYSVTCIYLKRLFPSTARICYLQMHFTSIRFTTRIHSDKLVIYLNFNYMVLILNLHFVSPLQFSTKLAYFLLHCSHKLKDQLWFLFLSVILM